MKHCPTLLALCFLATACGDDKSNDPNEPSTAPTDITLSSATAYANLGGRVVGRLAAAVEEQGVAVTFSLSGDNATYFTVSGTQLSTSSTVIPSATAPSLSLAVTATTTKDASFTKTFTITVIPTTPVSSNADSGAGSLRQTAADAPDNATLVLNVTTPIVLASKIELAKKLTLVGAGASTEVSGGSTSESLFQVADTGALTLIDLSLSHSLYSAIFNAGTLVIDGVTIHDSGNSDGRSGAIASSGTATLRHCTISGNVGYNAGAVDNYGTMHIDSCVFSNNVADGNSGGALINGGTLDVINTIFTANHADAEGRVAGAIGMFSPEESDSPVPTLHLAFVTMVGNSTAGVDGIGPALYLASGTHTDIRASVIAGNIAGSTTTTGDIYAANADVLTLGGYVSIGNGSGTALVSSDTNQVGTLAAPIAAGVDALASHGGSSVSMPPSAGSALIDKVPAAACIDFASSALTVDIRSQARPTGTSCDIGATEL